MSPKRGLLHDYDLHANREPSAKGNRCVVCEVQPMSYQWSDYSGEAMCTRCGTPYQLKWGSAEKQEEGAYPYLNLAEKWVPVVKEYWESERRFTCLGIMMLGPKPGTREFGAWVERNHPDMLEDE